MSDSKAVQSYRELDVYKEAIRLQQAVFEISKAFPKEETYSLTDQVRRSSRSIGANLAEAWAKRRYPAHFLSKLTDADGELQETLHWLRTARLSGYLAEESSHDLAEAATKVGRMLGAMIAGYESFCPAK
jgi:four helix bundle protein